MITRRRLLVAGTAVLASACAGQGARVGDGLTKIYARPDRGEWPSEFNEVPQATQQMYRYAVVNKAVLQYIPCFCGCVNGGHASNFDCYVREVLPDGRVQLDGMSFG